MIFIINKWHISTHTPLHPCLPEWWNSTLDCMHTHRPLHDETTHWTVQYWCRSVTRLLRCVCVCVCTIHSVSVTWLCVIIVCAVCVNGEVCVCASILERMWLILSGCPATLLPLLNQLYVCAFLSLSLLMRALSTISLLPHWVPSPPLSCLSHV